MICFLQCIISMFQFILLFWVFLENIKLKEIMYIMHIEAIDHYILYDIYLSNLIWVLLIVVAWTRYIYTTNTSVYTYIQHLYTQHVDIHCNTCTSTWWVLNLTPTHFSNIRKLQRVSNILIDDVTIIVISRRHWVWKSKRHHWLLIYKCIDSSSSLFDIKSIDCLTCGLIWPWVRCWSCLDFVKCSKVHQMATCVLTFWQVGNDRNITYKFYRLYTIATVKYYWY